MTIDNERLCLFEGQKWHKRSEINPDYASSADYRERLWLYLMGKEEMWNSFLDWSVKQYWIKADRGFFPWLTLPLDGVPRWVSLLSEWLGLESTREKWGWVECPCPPEFKGDEEIKRVCPYCSGTGRIRAEWAKV